MMMGYYSFSSDFQRVETALSFLIKHQRQIYFAAANRILFLFFSKGTQFHMGKTSSSY